MSIFDQIKQTAEQKAQQRLATYESIQQARRKELQQHARAADDFLDRRKRNIESLVREAAERSASSLPPVEWLTLSEAYVLTGYELRHLTRLINLQHIESRKGDDGKIQVNTQSLRDFLRVKARGPHRARDI
jgi:hypothetical protein